MGRPTGWLQTPGTVTGKTKVRQNQGVGLFHIPFSAEQTRVTQIVKVVSDMGKTFTLKLYFVSYCFRFLQDQAWN